jgi:hypothetical protein
MILGNSDTPINPSIFETKNLSNKELLEEALDYKMPKMKFSKKNHEEKSNENKNEQIVQNEECN